MSTINAILDFLGLDISTPASSGPTAGMLRFVRVTFVGDGANTHLIALGIRPIIACIINPAVLNVFGDGVIAVLDNAGGYYYATQSGANHTYNNATGNALDVGMVTGIGSWENDVNNAGVNYILLAIGQ